MRKQVQNKDNSPGNVRQLSFSLIIFLIALAGVVGAAFAWFSVSDNGRVNSMDFNITSGVSMRFDLSAHNTVSEYAETLNFAQISSKMQSDYGYNMASSPLVPVTTADSRLFTYQDGTASSENSGEYLTFVLHFMGEEDQVVHLTSDGGDNKAGTAITSANATLPSAMRISFSTDEGTWVYDPGIGDTSTTSGNMKTFGLPQTGSTDNSNNAMFTLKANEDKAVTVHVWLEGTDENCVNEVKKSDYAIALKFSGTDENNQSISVKSVNGKAKNQGNGNDSGSNSNNSQQGEEDIFDKISKAWQSILENHR